MQGERKDDISSSLNGRSAALGSKPSPFFPKQNQSVACSRPFPSSQREG